MKKFVKILSVLMALLLLVSAFASCSNTEETPDTDAATDAVTEDTTVDTEGDEPADESIVIRSATQLLLLAEQINKDPETSRGKTYRLGTDIDLNENWNNKFVINNGKVTLPGAGTPWIIIDKFYGTFDGNGKTISGVCVVGYDNAEGGAALFGELSGTVKNLTVGGLISVKKGMAAGLAVTAAEGAVIDGVTVKTLILTEDSMAAGIVAKAGGAFTMKNSKFLGALATIDATGAIPAAETTATVAQLVGDAADKAVALDTCVAGGKIFTNGTYDAYCAKGASAVTKTACTEEASTLDFAAPAIEIRTVEDLLALSTSGKTYEGELITLMNDIDLNPNWDATVNVTDISTDGKTYNVGLPAAPAVKWTPIKEFKGIFDGNGYTISGLYIDQIIGNSDYETSGVGFIGILRGTVRNLKVTNSLVVGRLNAESNGKNYTNLRVGSIAGNVYGTIEGVYSNANVWGAQTGGIFMNIGGIGGRSEADTCSITNCVFDGTLGTIKGYDGTSGRFDKTYIGGSILGCCQNTSGELTVVANNTGILTLYGPSSNVSGVAGQAFYVDVTSNIGEKHDAAWLEANPDYAEVFEYNEVLGYVVPKQVSAMFK